MYSHADQEKQITKTTTHRDERRDTITDPTDTERQSSLPLFTSKCMSENRLCIYFFLYICNCMTKHHLQIRENKRLTITNSTEGKI